MLLKASTIRLWMGLLALPAILLQQDPLGIFLQVVYVIILAVAHGRHFRFLPNFLLLISVSLAHLLQPNGLQLFTIAGYPVTAGALLLGARKALTLIALLYLSHYMVTEFPDFPGKLGGVLSLQFYYFERITSTWRTIGPKKPFIDAIDRLMDKLENEQESKSIHDEETKTSIRTPKKELVLNLVHLTALWSLYALGVFSLF